MRILVLSAVLWVGCATPASTKSGGEAAAGANEPLATLCNGRDGCSADHFCVKPLGSPEGVCSALPSGSECQRTSDCMSGAFCHRFIGQAGICFRP